MSTEKFDINEIINVYYGDTAERYFKELKEKLDNIGYETVCNLVEQCYMEGFIDGYRMADHFHDRIHG